MRTQQAHPILFDDRTHDRRCGADHIAHHIALAQELAEQFVRVGRVEAPLLRASDLQAGETRGELVRLGPDRGDIVRNDRRPHAAALSLGDLFIAQLLQASLDDLNRRLEHDLTMRRFRPNLVVSGCDPYAEDNWRRLRIGDLVLRVAKPCSRCIIPTIDPLTGERSAEPLRTLMGYRRRDNKVYFGQNLVHEGPAELVRGMAVEVLE